jgi:hypothetical protein
MVDRTEAFRDLGQQFHVENHAGAGGNLGMGAGVRAGAGVIAPSEEKKSSKGAYVSRYFGLVPPIGIAKLHLQIALLAQHDTDVHGEKKRHEGYDSPPGVQGQRKPDKQERQSQIDRIAREAKRP